ncbi:MULTISPECIES: nucleotide-binding protein [Methanoculleus]|uniref:Nucleic acid binding, OB-fold, tRNA/helicase-type n=2 Tax=Methanoculleus TaxID=45989 RepID=A3CY27_METMJ|nr:MULTISPECIES: nucleotide-binding protein [Methanoculleus]ABN58277.1 nucleic acid binding, OB-fold, tRNA/helicase-type [Methanoculleus marisnigri JR1]MCC7555290.1 nucleotide-binding protein [Methanoculleus marisnigri]UYU19651.1 nucleotide-binding protein [Methanoculleus submarinus]
MNLSEVTERISRKLEAKGAQPDRQKIESRLSRLVEEFGVNVDEAERTVTADLAREYNVTGVGSSSTELRPIHEIVPGEWVTIEGKIVALTPPVSPSIAQTGIIADSSGAIRFVTWARANAPAMEYGHWYRLESAVVDEYKGAPNLKIHSGTTIAQMEKDAPLLPSITPIAELKPGVGSVRAKFVQEWEASHDRMLQTGLLGDETGTIKFVIWKEDGAGPAAPEETPGKDKLDLDAVYNIYYATVDEYNGRLSLALNTAMYIADEGDIEVGRTETEIQGALVHVAPGSGLIKRCPVEGCNRTLSRQNYCPVHEIQPEFRYDLRIKAVLDDGIRARNVLMQREVVEALAGITLDEAIQIAETNPLGMDEIFYRIRNMVLGRYYTCSGNEFGGRLLVNSCTPIVFQPEELAALLNRAGGEPA